MAQCLQFLCCCFYSQARTTQGNNLSQNTRGRNKEKKKKMQPKPSRIISKYKEQEIIQISKQQKRKGGSVYTCPICTCFFNKILACSDCGNNMCRNCTELYETKFQVSKLNMKCPFCGSQTSNFIDFEQQARSYFDTTGKNGFLDANQRKKIDDQMNFNGSKYLDREQNKSPNRLQVIQEQGTHNLVSNRNLDHIQQYNEIVVENRSFENRNPQIQLSIPRRVEEQHEQQSMAQLNQNPNENVVQNDLNYIEQYVARSARNQN